MHLYRHQLCDSGNVHKHVIIIIIIISISISEVKYGSFYVQCTSESEEERTEKYFRLRAVTYFFVSTDITFMMCVSTMKIHSLSFSMVELHTW